MRRPALRTHLLTGLVVALAIDCALVGLRLLVHWPPALGLVLPVVTVLVPILFALILANASTRRSAAALGLAIEGLVLTAMVVGVYLLIVVGLGGAPKRGERQLVVLSTVAAALVAIGWQPARHWAQARARRLVGRTPVSVEESVETFGERLSRAVPMDELLLQVAEFLHRSLRLASVEVWSGSNERLARTAAIPHREAAELKLTPDEAGVVARAGVSTPAWASVWLPSLSAGRSESELRIVPLAHSGDLFGLFVVERGGDEEPFNEKEEHALAELGRRVGVALQNVQLDSALQATLTELRAQARELRESRNRVVTAGDAQRRKIERDLHDGAQQRLVALNLKVGFLRSVSDADPGTVPQALDELDRDLREALEELRQLVHGIYPPLLVDGGLPEALADAAARSPVSAAFRDGNVGRFDPDVEAAVYFCCLEALQNVAKYAGGDAKATVKIWQEEAALLFEVADTGAGFDAGKLRGGAGFMNMSDRVGALGGSLDIQSRPGGGTHVRGRIPVGGE